LKNQLLSSYAQDPGLGTGLSYFVPNKPYCKFILDCVSDKDVSVFHLTPLPSAYFTISDQHVSVSMHYLRLTRSFPRDCSTPELQPVHVLTVK
ncbi:hypothetical protein HYDPIDRAFT_91702, partial [Hydnomerulius pinastri MD-312]